MSTTRTTRSFVSILAAIAIAGSGLAACSTDSTPATAAAATQVATPPATPAMEHASMDTSAQVTLYTTMHTLWAQHMEWTFATVDAFFHEPDALEAKLNRLLQNQKDIGQAIAAYYGQEAGDQATKLLTEHIQGAVPVLTAAKKGDNAALEKALAAWQANAKQIADFLSAANPENWPASATEPMMKGHIDTTTTYAVDLLKGDHAKAIKDYDEAESHMLMLADTLAKGIIAQFPDKF